MSSALSALALDNITITFSSRSSAVAPYTAVKDTTLHVAAGEFVSVVGPTGCGKSTLLNVAAGLLQPSAGSITFWRRSRHNHRQTQLQVFRRGEGTAARRGKARWHGSTATDTT